MSARKTCFLVMPFSTKPTGLKPGTGPETINFDRLYSEIFEPVLNELGYDVERADQDDGALIIKQMIERLAYSDLVVADMSIPNGNVYYEVGIRHASRDRGCVMVSADWSKQLFDTDQMRGVRYPLLEGSITSETAKAAKEFLLAGIPGLADGFSPFFDTIEHKPVNPENFEGLEVFNEHTRKIHELKGRFHAIDEYSEDEAKEVALKLRDELLGLAEVPSYLLKQFIPILRDNAGWQETLDYIVQLNSDLRDDEWVEEQRLLTISQAVDNETGIGALEQLIATQGMTAERGGLLGGMQKRLWTQYEAAGDTRMAREKLNKAIKAYTDGMQSDLNDFYPSSNLPLLLKARGRASDLEKAQHIASLVVQQVERALGINDNNEWARQTLLVAAFNAQNVDKAEELADRVEDEGGSSWKLASTLRDLKASLNTVIDEDKKERLQEIVDRLQELQ